MHLFQRLDPSAHGSGRQRSGSYRDGHVDGPSLGVEVGRFALGNKRCTS